MKVYIFNPWEASGGPENLHQLCSKINDMGIECYMLYTFCHMGSYIPRVSDKNTFVPQYEHYNLKRTFCVDDLPENVIIIPEAYHPDVIYQVKHMKVVYWWLSVDNPKYSWDKNNPLFKNVINCYHADKAGKILKKYIEESNVIPLHDHINDIFIKTEGELISSLNKRKKVVLYNPQKQPNETTEKLISLVQGMDSSITFKPIQNMSLQEVSDLGVESRVYVDFGYHPGREHLPREMAISGCSIIVGDDGDASDDDDVPLVKRKFKKPYDFESISKMIVKEVTNHSSSFFDEELKNYREIVRKDKKRFESDVEGLIKKCLT